MKQIKTIMKRADDWMQFDAEVNRAVAEGWTLVKRDVLRPYERPTRIFHRMLYAELERETVGLAPHGCQTCKHINKRVSENPCHGCFNAACWEPRA